MGWIAERVAKSGRCRIASGGRPLTVVTFSSAGPRPRPCGRARHAGDLVPDAQPGFLDQPRRNVQVAVGGQIALAAPPQKGGAAFGNVENAEGGCGHLLTREIAVSHRTAVRATSVPVSLVGSRGARH